MPAFPSQTNYIPVRAVAPGNTTALVDTFARADTSLGAANNTNVGNGWIDRQGNVGSGGYQILSNTLVAHLDGVDGNQFNRDRLRAAGAASLSNMIEIVYPQSQTENSAAYVREQANGDCVFAQVRSDNGHVSVFTVIGGSPSAAIANNVAMDSWTSTKSYTLFISADPTIGISGSTTFYVEVRETVTGLIVFSVSSYLTTSSLQSAGFCGLLVYGNANSSTTLNIQGANLYTRPPSRTIGFVGDSLYVTKADATYPPDLIASPDTLDQMVCTNLIGLTGRLCTSNNQAISGKSSVDWAAPASILATAVSALVGVTVINVRIGTNDARAAVLTSKATYKANMITILTALAAVAPVVVHYPVWFQAGVAGGLWTGSGQALFDQYAQAIDEILASGIVGIYQGDRSTLENYQRMFLSLSQGNNDGHPNYRGYEALACKDAVATCSAMRWLS